MRGSSALNTIRCFPGMKTLLLMYISVNSEERNRSEIKSHSAEDTNNLISSNCKAERLTLPALFVSCKIFRLLVPAYPLFLNFRIRKRVTRRGRVPWIPPRGGGVLPSEKCRNKPGKIPLFCALCTLFVHHLCFEKRNLAKKL